MTSFDSRRTFLEKNISRLETRLLLLNRKSNAFSKYRLVIFLIGLTLTVTGFISSNVIGWIVLILFLAVFSITVHFHNKLLHGMRRCNEYLKIKKEHLARMNIDWEKIPVPIINFPPSDLSIFKDLDLTGNKSLHHIIDTSVSVEGSMMLSHWLGGYIIPGTIEQRQEIVQELSRLQVFRDKFILKARMVSKKALESGKIIEWLNKSHDYSLPGWLLPVSALLILAYIILFVINSIGIISTFWLIPFLIYFFIYSSHQKKMSALIEESLELEGHLKKFSSLIFFIEKNSFANSPALKKFSNEFFDKEKGTALKLRKLQKIISLLIVRENPIVRLIVNILFPYDIYFCKELIRAKNDIEKNIQSWFDKLSEFESLCSLANFSYLNPDYTFPQIHHGNEKVFSTIGIGHPLISRQQKICNDFKTEKKNEIVIITGSNMSGKSTFLKTVGINLCLAYAGSVVNASSFKTSLYDLFTCIKVSDSIADGLSYFYAEVKRLKELLVHFERNDDRQLFFLIDEIFKGTNNKERLEGSRAYIKKLSELKGTGFISTHDLELVNLENELPGIVNFHFREEVFNGKMHFDYKIHRGPCPTTNALKIMEMSGLPVR